MNFDLLKIYSIGYEVIPIKMAPKVRQEKVVSSWKVLRKYNLLKYNKFEKLKFETLVFISAQTQLSGRRHWRQAIVLTYCLGFLSAATRLISVQMFPSLPCSFFIAATYFYFLFDFCTDFDLVLCTCASGYSGWYEVRPIGGTGGGAGLAHELLNV